MNHVGPSIVYYDQLGSLVILYDETNFEPLCAEVLSHAIFAIVFLFFIGFCRFKEKFQLFFSLTMNQN